jgi:DNA-binding NarL/FixJ family response regulator
MIKVLIADDHPIVRQGLKQILSEESDMAVIKKPFKHQTNLIGVSGKSDKGIGFCLIVLYCPAF